MGKARLIVHIYSLPVKNPKTYRPDILHIIKQMFGQVKSLEKQKKIIAGNSSQKFTDVSLLDLENHSTQRNYKELEKKQLEPQ